MLHNENYEMFARCVVCCQKPRTLGASLESESREQRFLVCHSCCGPMGATPGVFPIHPDEWGIDD